MRIRDRIKSDAATFKRLDKREKMLFVWDYYRVPIIAATIVIVLVSIIMLRLGRNDTSLYVVMVNANNEVESTIIYDLLESGGVETENNYIDVETSYTLRYDDVTKTDVDTVEVLAVRFGIGDLDVFAADEAVFESYATKGAFVDLSLFIPAEILQQNEADLYRYKNEDGHEIVGGIWIREGSPMYEAGFYRGDALIGVAALAQNLDNAIVLVKQILVH